MAAADTGKPLRVPTKDGFRPHPMVIDKAYKLLQDERIYQCCYKCGTYFRVGEAQCPKCGAEYNNDR